ncbi:MAG TPA: transporter substrate-binding domain-containing protein [Spirochaetota bacterium]|nr:transporter substrate-binding domain-containing protein [Spirochaetota bacterium]HPJ44279.1 transporter substrate-binding domain-containing protein [Spirochaetota bacterium]HRX49679.1 transporter substrate-binding domain-containing protein [Spirochaetota bacterium]
MFFRSGILRFVIFLCASLMLLHVPLSSEPASENKKIIIGACDWEPYTGEKMKGLGLFSALSIEALKRAGYESKIVIYPWARALIEAREGNIHALLGASYTEDRINYFSYPEPLWTTKVVFFTSMNNGRNRRFTSVKNLAPARIGVLNGSNLVAELSGVEGITLDKAAAVELNIKKIAYGRMDYLVEDKTAVEYIIQMKMPELKNKIVYLYPPYKKESQYLVFSKKNPGYNKLTADFNRGLKSIINDGTYKKIVESFGFSCDR